MSSQQFHKAGPPQQKFTKIAPRTPKVIVQAVTLLSKPELPPEEKLRENIMLTNNVKEGDAGDVATATIIANTVVVPASTTPRQKRKKPKRDPNEPRRNLTSYVLFSNYIRPIIKERIQGISFIDLSKQMGLEFRQLSPEDREIWNGKAKEDKTRYELAMEEYRKTGAVANQNKQTPKKGKSSYNLYFQAMHDKMKTEHPELTFGELSKKMGQEFKSLPQDERKNWEELAKEDRKRALESSIEASALSSSTSSSRPNKPPPQKRSRKEKRDPNLPKKNLTSYIYFSNSIREEMKTNCPEATFCELGKLMGIEFKKLNQEQRDVFNVLAAKDKLRYDGAMVEYEAKKKKEQEIVKAEAVVVAEAAAVVVAEIVESKGDESGDESPVQAVVEC